MIRLLWYLGIYGSNSSVKFIKLLLLYLSRANFLNYSSLCSRQWAERGFHRCQRKCESPKLIKFNLQYIYMYIFIYIYELVYIFIYRLVFRWGVKGGINPHLMFKGKGVILPERQPKMVWYYRAFVQAIYKYFLSKSIA